MWEVNCSQTDSECGKGFLGAGEKASLLHPQCLNKIFGPDLAATEANGNMIRPIKCLCIFLFFLKRDTQYSCGMLSTNTKADGMSMFSKKQKSAVTGLSKHFRTSKEFGTDLGWRIRFVGSEWVL